MENEMETLGPLRACRDVDGSGRDSGNQAVEA